MGTYWQSFQSLHICSVSLSLQLKLVPTWLNHDSEISVIRLPPGPMWEMRGGERSSPICVCVRSSARVASRDA
jgi:hypothetical protein